MSGRNPHTNEGDWSGWSSEATWRAYLDITTDAAKYRRFFGQVRHMDATGYQSDTIRANLARMVGLSYPAANAAEIAAFIHTEALR